MSVIAKPKPKVMAPSDELDDVTFARAQRGDAQAFRALVVHYQRAVFSLVGRMLSRSSRTTIEDVAQETFLRVFRALPNFSLSGPARLSTWVLTIATRVALDELRKYSPPTTPLEEMVSLPSEERTEAGLERRVLGEALEQAVSQLSPVYRAAFLLRECHDLSYEEISSALGIDVGTVKSRLLRARNALRAALTGMLYE